MGRLADVLEGYLDLRWRVNPVEGTYVGRHEFDSELSGTFEFAERIAIIDGEVLAFDITELAQSLADRLGPHPDHRRLGGRKQF